MEKQGEDTVAQLWRSPLDHLEYVVVEGFKVDGFDDEEVQIAVDRIVDYLYSRLRSHSDDFLRFARVSAEDLELKLEGVDQVRGAVVAGTTASDELKARLQKEIAEEEQSRLFPKLVSSIFQVAEAGVDDPELLEDMFLQLLDALLLQEDFAIINQIVLKLRAMEDRPGMSGIRQLKDTFVAKMGDEQRLVRVADVLRTARPTLLQDIGRYLASLQPTTLPILLGVLETLDAPEHRLVLCDVIAEFCKVNPAEVIQRLSSERPMTVRDMVYVLERAQHPDRMQFFGRVLKHKNLAVRLDVMGTIARGRSVESRRLIAGALKDENAQVRVQAARLLPGVRPRAGLPGPDRGGEAQGLQAPERRGAGGVLHRAGEHRAPGRDLADDAAAGGEAAALEPVAGGGGQAARGARPGGGAVDPVVQGAAGGGRGPDPAVRGAGGGAPRAGRDAAEALR